MEVLAGTKQYCNGGEHKDHPKPQKPVPCSAEMIVTFSLWGHGDCYNYGALENALTIPKMYPSAALYFYVDVESVQKKILIALSKLAHTRIIPSTGQGKMFWRFKPAFNEKVLPVLVRDADSLVTPREVSAVQEWIDGSKDLHVMRDAKGHDFVMLGGMWASRNGFLIPLRKQFKNYGRGISYGVDQEFLRDVVYPFGKRSLEVHDEIFTYNADAKRFPLPRNNEEDYVGRIVCHSPNAFRFLGETQRELPRDRIEAYREA